MLRPFLPMFMPRGGAVVVTPVLTSLRDLVIDTAGGGRAQVATGTGFGASSVIKVGGAAQATTYDAGTGTLSCTMPAHAAGSVPVTVANGAAESGAINVKYAEALRDQANDEALYAQDGSTIFPQAA